MPITSRIAPIFAVAFFISAPAFAATTIKVVEGGESGGPMTLTLDKPSIKAGETIFEVHNDAMSENHEMVVVKLKSADQKLPLIASKHRLDEKQLHSMGEVADLKPGGNGKLMIKLTAGSYLVFCNIKGHYEAGMQAKLTVTP